MQFSELQKPFGNDFVLNGLFCMSFEKFINLELPLLDQGSVEIFKDVTQL